MDLTNEKTYCCTNEGKTASIIFSQRSIGYGMGLILKY